MSYGLYSVVCPSCGDRLTVVDAGEAWCSPCGQGFLLRMGHLLPLAPSASFRPLTGQTS